MIPGKVKAILEQNGLKALEFEPGSTPTAVMAAEKIGVEVAQIAKSLLFRGKNEKYYLVVCTGDRKVSSSVLKKITGVKTSMTSFEDTLRITGFPPGGVCPFAVEGVTILLDRELGSHDLIFPAAGTDATGVPMTLEQLAHITGGQVVDLDKGSAGG